MAALTGNGGRERQTMAGYIVPSCTVPLLSCTCSFGRPKFKFQIFFRGRPLRRRRNHRYSSTNFPQRAGRQRPAAGLPYWPSLRRVRRHQRSRHGPSGQPLLAAVGFPRAPTARVLVRAPPGGRAPPWLHAIVPPAETKKNCALLLVFLPGVLWRRQLPCRPAPERIGMRGRRARALRALGGSPLAKAHTKKQPACSPPPPTTSSAPRPQGTSPKTGGRRLAMGG